MKKTLLLFFALLTLGVSGALAETVTWTSGSAFNESTGGNHSVGWFSVTSPYHGTITDFTVNLGNNTSRKDAYLAISKNVKSATTGFTSSDFVAISKNKCGTTDCKVTMEFDETELFGGATYYFYFVTESGGIYTTVTQRYYVVGSYYGVNIGNLGSAEVGWSSYAIPFTSTMTLKDNLFFRMKALYPDDDCYVYSNASDENKLWKNTNLPSVTNTRYLWKATLKSGVVIQNLGNSHYIAKISGDANGKTANYLGATTEEDAEKFELKDNNIQGNSLNKGAGYVALKSTTAASDTYLNTYTSGSDKVGSYTAQHNKSGQFLFQQVKTVTFSTPVAVNGGDAISTIYVAMDGSDSFTLPNGCFYSINGGAELTNTEAAAAIAAAGTSDLTVSVNNSVVTYNLIFQGSIIRTKDVNRTEVIGDAALPESSWNHECCAYSFSPSTITSETETVNITMSWNIGDLIFSSDYASATWYHMSLHNKWAKYDETVNGTPDGHPLYGSLDDVNYDVVGSAGMWAFVGNPLDGVYLINKEAGDGQVLGWTTPPKMQSISEGSSKKFIITKYGNPATGFILNYSGYYINDLSGGSRLKFWYDSGGASSAGSAITVSPISLYEQSLIELDEYAAEHAEGEYFGLKSSAVSSLRESIKTAKASYNSAAYSAAHSAIEALWPGDDNANVNYPGTGYYLIRSYGRSPYRYMQIDDTGKPVTTTTNTGVGNVVTLTELANHKYKIQMQGQYLDAPKYNGSFLDMTASNEGAEFDTNVANVREVGFKSGNDYNYIHPRNSGTYGLMSYWGPSSDAASGWVIEDVVPITITLHSDRAGTPTYYSTLCLPFDATISNATAYTLAKSGSWLVPTAVTDNKVPAGTAVLLKGTNETATATINTGDAFGSPLTCALVGTYTDKAVTKTDGINSDDYYLGIYSGVVGFYKWDGSTLGANRAYLPKATAEAAVKGFSIRWADETGVEVIEHSPLTIDHEAGAVFDLSGRRVSKAQRGLYIQNGKKVMVK